ncbi:MAG: hypothetical protein WCQ99_07575 [Pseudomonadota bacterium]
MKLFDFIKAKLMGKAPEGSSEVIVSPREERPAMPELDTRNIMERLAAEAGEAIDPAKQDKLLEKVDELKGKIDELQGAAEKPEEKIEERQETDDGLREPERKQESKAVFVPKKKAFGLDIGTSRIVCTHYGPDGAVSAQNQLNAFFSVPESIFVRKTLDQTRTAYVKLKDEIAVLGYGAEKFANTFNIEIRRPMKKGLLKPSEFDAVPILKEIINLVVPRADEVGRSLCFSVPAPEAGFESDLIFHEGILRKYLIGMGYNAKSITEGTAIVLSELADHNFTGIGISMGAGMCNVCFSFLAVPVIVFSLAQGGDDIDERVARVSNETINRVRVIKEEALDFSRPPSNTMENAFNIYYDELLVRLLTNLSAVLTAAEHMPRLVHAIPIVLAGGTSMPIGFKSKFEKILHQISLPIEISEVRMAADPLTATARGALINASA